MINQRDTLKKALFEAMSEKYENELSNIDSEQKIICSKKHYLKLSAILGFKVNQNKKFSVRLLIGILIAALILTGCTAYVYRNEIKEFFVEIYEKHILVTYDTENDKNGININNVNDENNAGMAGENNSKIYQATYMKKDYEIINQTKTAVYVFYEWHDSSGNVITLQQMPFDGADYFLDAEHGNTEIINYEQYKIYCRKFENSCSFIWNDGVYAFTLKSSEQLSNEELFKIIKGIK